MKTSYVASNGIHVALRDAFANRPRETHDGQAEWRAGVASIGDRGLDRDGYVQQQRPCEAAGPQELS